MLKKSLDDRHGRMEIIELKDIDPSPFQRRKHFDKDKLKGLAASIQREGLIEPIVVRYKRDRYELISGERRFRAVRDYTEMETIPAQIVKATYLEARRMAAAKNLQREELSVIEMIEAIVEIVDADLIEDAELIEDKEYALMGKNPADRVKRLLGRLHSITISKNRGSKISKKTEAMFHKFEKQLEKIFKNLPNLWNGGLFSIMIFQF